MESRATLVGVTESTQPAPADADRQTGRGRSGGWRIGTPVVVVVCGLLFAVSAADSDGTDLRPGRYTDLASLTQKESDDNVALQAEAERLREEVATLGEDVQDARVRRVRREADSLRAAAGLEPVSGAGVTVVLSDASRDQLEQALRDEDLDLNRLLVHQQDIQAVVNALWIGGAEAVTIQGQRVITTTGIKCTGSAVTLQGVPYPQPYTIQAVGDPALLAAALDANPDVAAYRSDADNSEIGVGWDMAAEAAVEAPAFSGTVDLGEAQPLPAP